LFEFYNELLVQQSTRGFAESLGEHDSQQVRRGFGAEAVDARETPIAEKSNIAPENILEAIYRRYSTFKAPTLSYATVRDYCDSMDYLPNLATINKDMKEVQRPWLFKTILGTVKRGSRLLEIGAGEPFVADLLSRLGYEVLIVDPYDGSGNGPAEYEAIKASYPGIKFIRNCFTDNLQGIDPASFDGIYSISVLEHIPMSEIGRVFAGIRRFLKNGGYSIHAIDHVLKGNGDKYHLKKLRTMIDAMGIPDAELDSLLRCLDDDVETYFLSAFGHDLWRSKRLYDEFPMRRCVSIHTCTRIIQPSQ
jgi:hypothetical protein